MRKTHFGDNVPPHMRITIELDADGLRRIREITGEPDGARAVAEVVDRFLKLHEAQALSDKTLAGQIDFAAGDGKSEPRDSSEEQ